MKLGDKPSARHPRWVVVDTETSGLTPSHARVIGVAAITVDENGKVEDSFATLLDPGCDPGPTHIHGLTAADLAGSPQFADIWPRLAEMLDGRTLVAHNAAFDYGFLAAEAELIDQALPTRETLCTFELARRLDLKLESLKLQSLAEHCGIEQLRAHDAYDDARVLAEILPWLLRTAHANATWLPRRDCAVKRWPNGRVTHVPSEPVKTRALRLVNRFENPGRFVLDRPLVSGMSVALAPETRWTHDELIERLVHAGLSYTDQLSADTSLLISNDVSAETGRAAAARELGIPVVDDDRFVELLRNVISGAPAELFARAVSTAAGDQFALF